MVHIKAVSVRKANEGSDDPPPFSFDQLLALLGGSVQEILLAIIQAKGKSTS